MFRHTVAWLAVISESQWVDEPYKQAIGLKNLFITTIEVNNFD